ncbi:aldo/keto reductase, putative [Talaromyces stipitatus ATCC 10500]|uniref:Aldo/keto reductase, putative n=1 Tax=Talaromyces stipitatus (strain ATCC 10500 / CBS 375.48 / QM 6759 / NRRL 1006) TaxID=441959 RepID=B8MGC6_TALSN|nr:aldo/keto reductase, putative [Talaromyces stipitatus ATCC 10500]EED16246.1 aldo/keto reductase, putative [Talaromyces stipitatus ATCC 10500]
MPPSKAAPQLVLGLANVGDTSADPMARYGTPNAVKQLFDTFFNRGYTSLDTARNYPPHAPGTAEPLIGAALKSYEEHESTKPCFTISTKIMPRGDRPHTREKIEQNIIESLTALQLPQVDIEYLHDPDRTTPFEETCEAMDKACLEGKFRRFGLSNHKPEEIERVVKICEENGYVKPSVYQGHYNAIARAVEKDLLPVLRKHGISFYAFSPAAAGMFSGNHKRNAEPGNRYDPTVCLMCIHPFSSTWRTNNKISSPSANSIQDGISDPP